MRIRLRPVSVLLFLLCGQLCLSGAVARAFAHAGPPAAASLPAFRELRRSDPFADELRKRQTREDRVALCRDARFSLKKAHAGRSGCGECARDANTELVFLGLAALRVDSVPPRDARVPETPFLSLPPSRSPPSR